MISNYTVLAIPQYAIFAAFTVMVYAWVEKKRVFGMIGSGILLCLGIFAAWAIFAGWMVPEYMLEISEELSTAELFDPDELPIEGRLLPFYWMLVGNGVIAGIALFTEIYRKRFATPVKVIAITISLALFFLMLAAVRS
jgi:hypothetical protein